MSILDFFRKPEGQEEKTSAPVQLSISPENNLFNKAASARVERREDDYLAAVVQLLDMVENYPPRVVHITPQTNKWNQAQLARMSGKPILVTYSPSDISDLYDTGKLLLDVL